MNRAVNEIDPEKVRREERNGRNYLVAPITLIRSMELDKGYVPKDHVRRSAPAWNGIPLTIGHPRNPQGDIVSANSPEVLDKTSIGRIFGNKPEDDTVQGEAWFDIQQARNIGGEATEVIDKIEDGEAVSVSSGYLFDRLEPGEYDGEHRDTVAGNLKPDHVAVLINGSGICSISDGCAVGEPAVNMAIHADDPEGEDTGMNDVAVNVLSSARTPTFDGTESTSWGDVSKSMSAVTSALGIDASSVEDLSANEKSRIANHTLLGDSDADSWRELFFFPVVNPNSGNLNEGALDAVRGGRGAQANISSNALESARNRAASLLEEHFDREISENSLIIRGKDVIKELLGGVSANDEPAESGDCGCDNMTEKTKELVESYGFNEDALPDEDSDEFDRIYEALNESEETEESENPEGSESEEPEETEGEPVTMEALEERFATKDDVSEAVSEALSANREEQKTAELVDRVIATNEDYDEDDRETLMETPDGVLEGLIVDKPAGNADWSATPGASAVSGNEDDVEGFPALSARERIAEMNGDD